MYDDYPTIYETTFDQTLIIMTVIGIVSLIITIFTLFSMSIVYKKANRSKISAWIPIYNILVLLEIVNLPKWYLIMLLVPGLNILFGLKIMEQLAKFFRKSKLFGIGLLFLPFIYFPILAFGDSEYVGINLVAQEGTTTVTNIPQIDTKEEKNIVVNEEVDQNNRNINISIGGGVYQKDYTKTLLNTDEDKKIEIKPELVNNKRDTSNNSFIRDVQETKQEETKEVSNINVIEMPNMIESENLGINNNNITNNNQEEYKICPKCHTKLKKDNQVCFICGNKL